jgi:AcrR family transcriptional regulator
MDADEALLKAAYDTLSDRGFATLTIDEVAHRANVHPESVTCRWRSRHDVVIELLRSHAARPKDSPDSGDIRTDLTEVIAEYLAAAHRLRHLASAVIGEAPRDEELRREMRLFVHSWHDRARALHARGIERGELRQQMDDQRAADLCAAIVWFRILLLADLSLQGVPEQLVDPILRAWGHEPAP